MSATTSAPSVSSALAGPIAAQIARCKSAIKQKPGVDKKGELHRQLEKCSMELMSLQSLEQCLKPPANLPHHELIAARYEKLLTGKYAAILDRVLSIGQKITPSTIHVVHEDAAEKGG